MAKLLRPQRLDIDPNSPNASKEWKHWLRSFNNFVTECGDQAPDKHRTLENFASAMVFEIIEDCASFDDAVTLLTNLYVKTPNEIFARHMLATRRQQSGESLDEFLQVLRSLSKTCNLKAVSAETYREELIRDSFISGINSSLIRQRLLENITLTLQAAYDQAKSLDLAQKNNDAYGTPSAYVAATTLASKIPGEQPPESVTPTLAVSTSSTSSKNCYFCGSSYHARINCRARNSVCNSCGKKGHYAKVCMSKRSGLSKQSTTAAIVNNLHCAVVTKVPSNLSYASAEVSINGHIFSALIDSASSDSFISKEAAQVLRTKREPSSILNVSMATGLEATTQGSCKVTVILNGTEYTSTKLGILENLCSDIILGQDFQKQHERVIIEYGGKLSPLQISNDKSHCALTAASVIEPTLFPALRSSCKPIATQSRRFSKDDRDFIGQEVSNLLSHKIIEPSMSPWRAQIVIAKDELNRHKKRLCIDYSQTINQYTELDAYPLPRIDEMVNKLSSFKVLSTFDLKNAYHQIPISENDKKYTAFEANGRLYQFCRIPFGVTNGVSAFQRMIDKVVEEDNLQGTFPYLDNVTVGGMDQEEHDANVNKFLESCRSRNLTLNESKSILSSSSINVLGYCVGNGIIKPDPERFTALRDLPPPTTPRSLRRTLGIFAYYAKWVHRFADKIKPLSVAKVFPLNQEALESFNLLKRDLEKVTLAAIDENTPFVVECDASDVAISATLNQGGRPVAFMSRTLSASELHYPAIEKEATAIIEAVRKWNHLLSGRHFKLVTDQRSVAFMLDNRKRTKIKNNKIQGWRVELASFSYSIEYRPGDQNVAADALTRANCATISAPSSLTEIHAGLCHPGVTRMLHFIRSKNLPYSTDEVKKVCSDCRLCAELKPQFFKPPDGILIKSTSTMERLNIDFKGPLPTSASSRNKYLFVAIDEFSRYPFAMACPNMNSETVIKCLNLIFGFCGTPAYIHSDRGAALISKEVKEYLNSQGISSSKTTPYNPQGNGQVEGYNRIIWKAVRLALKTNNLPDSSWEAILPYAVSSIRALLCTTTNCTPHERFFSFQRRSFHGNTLPAWLTSPGPVLLRRFVRGSKNDPYVDEVELTEANPLYAHVRYPDGRESTVSLRDLARCPPDKSTSQSLHQPTPSQQQPLSPPQQESGPSILNTEVPLVEVPSLGDELVASPTRRSMRQSKPPIRYQP